MNPINYKQLLTEERTTSAPYGCLMAKIIESQAKKIIEFGKRIISDEILYTEGSEFGREGTPHVTIKYGFNPDLTELEIRRILKGISPFMLNTKKLSLFDNNPKYDVVKFDVESPILIKIRRACEQFPTQDDYPEYHPHLTLAYIEKGSFVPEDNDIKMSLMVREIYYSPAVGEKSYFKL